MLAIAKFGGSSLSCAANWKRVREIVTGDIARRVIVVSAAGKRHADDHKITDLLYLCHAHLRYGVPCWELWRKIAGRYLAIRDECAINFPIEDELDAIYENLSPQTSADFLASRGENLSAKLMAAYLGFSFVDAASWLQFDYAGNVLTDSSYAALSSLADGRKIVTPGFYGALPDGKIHTLPRGGSDVTGALAAAALHADLYENWTDVTGVLAADPRLIQNPAPVGQLRYEELQTLSRVGMQILHEDAVAPVRQAQIPLRICNTHDPENPGTLVRPQMEPGEGQICFAGRRQLAMLRLTCPQEPDAETKLADVLEQARHFDAGAAFAVFHAERVRRTHGAFTDEVRLRTPALSAGAGRAGAAPAIMHAARKPEHSGRALPFDRHRAGTAPRSRKERRASPPAAKMRSLRPHARQRQSIRTIPARRLLCQPRSARLTSEKQI